MAAEMRVALDGRSLRSKVPRGWDRYTLELVSRLPEYGVRPTLLYRAGEPLAPEHLAAAGCEAVEIASRTVVEWEQLALPRRLARGGFDLYHAVAERGVPLLSPCPVVLTLHSLTYHSYQSFIDSGLLSGSIGDYLDAPSGGIGGVYAEAQFRMADHLVAPSRFCAREIERLLPAPRSKITVTALGVARQFECPPSSEARISEVLARLGIRRPYVLYVGGYERHKNPAGLLKASQRLLELRPELQMVLVGTQRVPDELRALVGHDPRCHFLVDVSDDLVALYDAASVFLSLSWRESFGLPALEAMSRGVPVVASEWGAAREVVGNAGILIDPRDIEQAVAGVARLLDQQSDPDALRRRAALFNWNRCAATTNDLYRSLLRSPSRMRRVLRAARRSGAALEVAARSLAR